eukprot:SAG22_NODE_1738_length_3688_cov_1.400390_1_plen_702_part_10
MNVYETTPVHFAAGNMSMSAAMLDRVLREMMKSRSGVHALVMKAHSMIPLGVDGHLRKVPHQTPVHILAARDDVTPELMLLTCATSMEEAKAPACQQTYFGDTPLHLLCSPERHVDFLGKYGIERWRSLFAVMHTAIKVGMQSPLEIKNDAGLTPLHMLATQESLRDQQVTAEALREISILSRNLFLGIEWDRMSVQGGRTAVGNKTVLHLVCASESSTFLTAGIGAVLSGRLEIGSVGGIASEECVTVDVDGRNALHILLANSNCSRAILRQYCANFRDEELALAMRQEDAYGMTPMHVVLANCTDAELLTELLKVLKPHIAPDLVGAKDKKDLSGVHYAIDNLDQEALELLFSKNPSDVGLVQDGSGLTILHRACSAFTLKPDLVQTIVRHCPESAAIVDIEGRTPLHVLARRQSRTTDGGDRLACIQAVAAKCPEAVLVQEKRRTGQSQKRWADNTVLHDICAASYVDEAFISAVVESEPKVGELINLAGCTPLQTLLQRSDLDDKLESLLQCFTTHSPDAVQVGGLSAEARALRPPDAIPKPHNPYPTALHTLCRRPKISARLVKALGPGAEKAAVVVDSDGQTPLHLLCLRPDLLDLPNCVAVVCAVAEANPDACKAQMHFDKGLKRGVVPDATPAHIICKRPVLTAALLRAIFQTCPSAAAVPDMDRLVMHPVHKGVVDETIVGELPIHRLLTNTQ